MRAFFLLFLGAVCACGGLLSVESETLKGTAYGPRCVSAAECPSTGVCRAGRCAPHWEGNEDAGTGVGEVGEVGCGNGVVDPGEACDDGNDVDQDSCLSDCTAARCGDGFVQAGAEACDDESERCAEDCQFAHDGSSPERSARSCRHLMTLHPESETGQYWIQPGELSWRVVCDMDFDGGGWTRVARVIYDAPLWDAWSDAHQGAESFGIPISSLSSCCLGEDLTYHFVVDGERYPYRYRDVMGPAFEASAGARSFDPDGALVSPEPGQDYIHCDASLTRQNTRWNWSVSQSLADGCSGYRTDGFLLAGSAGRDEQATKIFGLGRFTGDTFTTIEVFAREDLQ